MTGRTRHYDEIEAAIRVAYGEVLALVGDLSVSDEHRSRVVLRWSDLLKQRDPKHWNKT